MNQGFLNALPFRRTFDYTAAGTIRSLEDSHQRMGLNRFDIVYIHDCSEDWHGVAWKERFAEAMAGAAQVLSAMRDRGEAACSSLETISLPVPCSPVIRTLASDGPT